MKTSGTVISIVLILVGEIKLISSKKALNNKKQAKLALPTE